MYARDGGEQHWSSDKTLYSTQSTKAPSEIIIVKCQIYLIIAVAVCVDIWQDHSLWTTVKRVCLYQKSSLQSLQRFQRRQRRRPTIRRGVCETDREWLISSSISHTNCVCRLRQVEKTRRGGEIREVWDPAQDNQQWGKGSTSVAQEEHSSQLPRERRKEGVKKASRWTRSTIARRRRPSVRCAWSRSRWTTWTFIRARADTRSVASAGTASAPTRTSCARRVARRTPRTRLTLRPCPRSR